MHLCYPGRIEELRYSLAGVSSHTAELLALLSFHPCADELSPEDLNPVLEMAPEGRIVPTSFLDKRQIMFLFLLRRETPAEREDAFICSIWRKSTEPKAYHSGFCGKDLT